MASRGPKRQFLKGLIDSSPKGRPGPKNIDSSIDSSPQGPPSGLKVSILVNGDAPESYRGQSVDEKSLFCSTMGRCQLSIYTCSRHLSAAICRGCGLHSPFSWWLTAEISN